MNIFQPDNFSDPAIFFSEVLTDEKEIVIDVVKMFFVNPQIIKITKIAATGINSDNYWIILKTGEEEKSILLRRFKQLSSKRLIDFYLNLIEDLKMAGIKVSRVIKTLRGGWTFEFDYNFYGVFEFIEGKHFEPIMESFLSVASDVAKMHQFFKKIDLQKQQEIEEISKLNSKAYFNKIKKYTWSDFDAKIQVIKNKETKSVNEKNLIEEADFLFQIIKEVEANKLALKKLTRAVIHSDLHPHNLIMQGCKVGAILDFDSVRVDHQALEVGFALYRFGRQFLIGNSLVDKDLRNKAVDLKNKFINKYQEINPLTEEEISLMPILMKDEFLKKLLFVLKGVYDEDNKSWEGDLIKFLMALKEINYFFN